MIKKIAINGFGRIGRLTLRNLLGRTDVEVVAINDLTNNTMLAHLFKYDSAQGTFLGEVIADEQSITINGKQLHAFTEKDPSALPWKKLGVDVVLECTGVFRTKKKASLHLKAGAKRVVISAPAKSDDVQTIVIGVNDSELDTANTIFSNASCTTNCLAPIVKIIDEAWGFEQGTMTTIHAYTSSQNLQDGPHKDMRRARAAAINIVPTTTGAGKATELVYPAIKGKMDAMAIRVPVVTGSLIELDCIVNKEVGVEQVNEKFKVIAQQELKGVLYYSEDPLVSSDIVGNPHSSIFDAPMTRASGRMLKVISWYDNEAGYSARLADLALMVARLPEPAVIS